MLLGLLDGGHQPSLSFIISRAARPSPKPFIDLREFATRNLLPLSVNVTNWNTCRAQNSGAGPEVALG